MNIEDFNLLLEQSNKESFLLGQKTESCKHPGPSLWMLSTCLSQANTMFTINNNNKLITNQVYLAINAEMLKNCFAELGRDQMNCNHWKVIYHQESEILNGTGAELSKEIIQSCLRKHGALDITRDTIEGKFSSNPNLGDFFRLNSETQFSVDSRNLMILRLFAKAAEELAEKNLFPLATVDCHDWTDVCRSANVSIYPSVKVYLNGITDSFLYTGSLSTSAIVNAAIL